MLVIQRFQHHFGHAPAGAETSNLNTVSKLVKLGHSTESLESGANYTGLSMGRESPLDPVVDLAPGKKASHVGIQKQTTKVASTWFLVAFTNKGNRFHTLHQKMQCSLLSNCPQHPLPELINAKIMEFEVNHQNQELRPTHPLRVHGELKCRSPLTHQASQHRQSHHHHHQRHRKVTLTHKT